MGDFKAFTAETIPLRGNFFRPLPAAPPGKLAVIDQEGSGLRVVDPNGGSRTVNWRSFGRVRSLYFVDMREHYLELRFNFLSADHFGHFIANVAFVFRIIDPLAVVLRGVQDVQQILEPTIEQLLAEILRSFSTEDVITAERAAGRALVDREAGGGGFDENFALSRFRLSLQLDAAAVRRAEQSTESRRELERRSEDLSRAKWERESQHLRLSRMQQERELALLREALERAQIRSDVEAEMVAGIVRRLEADVRDNREYEARELVARVLDGDIALTSVLPAERPLKFAVRIAIPERQDVAGNILAPVLPEVVDPTVTLQVVLSGNVWPRPPEPQEISVSRHLLTKPSTWAVFPFTTPPIGKVVTINILVLYQGKPLRSATYESPVRQTALPGELASLTAYALSGPDEPTEELRPVEVTLDGVGSDLTRLGRQGRVPLTDVRGQLDYIEQRISRVLGVTDAPASFDDPKALELLIRLARIGHRLRLMLAPLEIGDEGTSINMVVNDSTPVLPLELVYAGPEPRDDAALCHHIDPLPVGQRCTNASAGEVCPYAFWGVYRSIARTVRSKQRAAGTAPLWTAAISASSVLFGATVIADDGAETPLPTDSVFAFAKQLYRPVIRVRTWERWRTAIETNKPNLLVVLGHVMTEGDTTNLYIGARSALPLGAISALELVGDDGRRPLVLLIACASATRGDPFGTLPGAMTASGAGAVVGTIAKIAGPQGAMATTHLLRAVYELAGQDASVGSAVQRARRSLIADKRPIGLVLVAHGEMDTKVTG